MKINLKNIELKIIFICLFFTAMNFFSKFFYLAFGTTVIAFVMLFILKNKPKIDVGSLFYLLVGIIMCFYHRNDGVLPMLRAFSFFAFYMVGFNIVLRDRSLSSKGIVLIDGKDSAKTAYGALIAISLGSFVHYLLNFINALATWSERNNEEITSRNTPDIWTGEILSATGHVALACLMIGLALAMFLCPEKKYLRIISISIIIVLFAYDLILAVRTLFVIFIIVFLVGFIFLLTNIKILQRIKKVKKLLKYLAYVFVPVMVVSVIFIFNIGGITDIVRNSNLYKRFFDLSIKELLKTSRISIKFEYLKEAYKYPFGGGNIYMQNEMYAHDLLLDAYDVYGIFTFILLACILVMGLKNLYHFCKDKQQPLPYKIGFLCVYTAILLEFFVEPILIGMPWLFTLYCIINGCLAGIRKQQKARLKSESETAT